MGRRSRRRAQGGDAAADAASTTEHVLDDGSVLILRDSLSAGTLRKLGDLEARPSASAEDRWQRRLEFLFERLAVSWEIAGLPLEGQKELLGRLRLASAEERRAVTRALGDHLREHHPSVEL
jgi:hypothetical protein